MSRRRTTMLLAALTAALLGAGLLGAPAPARAAALHPPITAISAGSYHMCAITEAGGVQCWGYNVSGQIGDGAHGNDPPRSLPRDAVGLQSGVVAVSAGGYHTCALTEAGGVKCWGSSRFGTVGVPPETNLCFDSLFRTWFPCIPWPVDVTGLERGVVAISAGGYQTCALMEAGTVKCWGWAALGHLGNGSYDPYGIQWEPVDVCADAACTEPLSGVAAISAAGHHTCALLTAGGVKCWGANDTGQLGVPEESVELCPDPFASGNFLPCSTTPVDVCADAACAGPLTGIAAVTTGSLHTCALTQAGGAQCWGNASELGDGTTTDRYYPGDVLGLTSGIVAIAAGSLLHTCAVLETGGAQCWGDNFVGMLGDGTETDRATPAEVCLVYDQAAQQCAAPLEGVAAIDGGFFYTCALTEDADLLCWGDNCCGQFGNGISDFEPHPTPVPARADWDGDGCLDAQERAENPALGGRRDPKNLWDFFDVRISPEQGRDRAITAGDILSLVRRFGTTGDPASDPRTLPHPPATTPPSTARPRPIRAGRGRRGRRTARSRRTTSC